MTPGLDAVFRLIAPAPVRAPAARATVGAAMPAPAYAPPVAAAPPCTTNSHIGVFLGFAALAGGLIYFARSSADARAKDLAGSLELEEAAERELVRRSEPSRILDSVGYEPGGHCSHHHYPHA